MLAAIDDESDSSSQAIQRPKEPSRRALAPITGNVRNVERLKGIEQESDNGDEEEEDEVEDDEPIIPRGRLVAQLQGQALKSPVSRASDEEVGNENAYARIKKQLLQTGAKKIHETTSSSESDVIGRRRPASRGSRSDHGENLRSSPGLFVSPEIASGRHLTPEKQASKDGSDSDLPANPQTNSRFIELVARKRAEREARQAEEDQKRAEKIAKQRSFQEQLSRDASSGSDEDGIADRRLTQQSRPTRKASKKAFEEMNRETQRMSRNMQLAHQAKTKKKITKDSLFARFNFRTSTNPNIEATQNPSSSTAASSAPVSEMEDTPGKESPPTSPVEPDESSLAPQETDADKESTFSSTVVHPARLDDDELPSMQDIFTQPAPIPEKGKGKAVEEINLNDRQDSIQSKKTPFTQPPIKIRPPKSSKPFEDRGSDSDLDILPIRKNKRSKFDVFDRLPASKVQDARSLQTLRALAHLNSPEKQRQGKKAAMTLTDMQMSLQRRARLQALEERAGKIEDLKSRGIIVQTSEERQKDQAEVEDLLEKARREGEQIKQKEKRAAKKEKIANGEVDDLPDTSDEDEDYQEDGDDDEPDVELSGSEEEQVDNADEADESASDAEELSDEDEEKAVGFLDEDKPENNGLIENEASEDGDDEEDENVNNDMEEDDDGPNLLLQRSRRSRLVIADDDEEEDDIHHTQNSDLTQKDGVEISNFPPGLESFKLTDVPMGMTQAFAATMADSQAQGDGVDDEEDSMAYFGPPPEPNFPMFDLDDSPQIIEDSQNGQQLYNANWDQKADSSKDIQLDFSQSQIRYDASGDTQNQATTTQVSEMPDPTQDVGFTLSSPAPERFTSVPPSTVDTVLLPGSAHNESPIKKRRGRLQRGAALQGNASALAKVSAIVDNEGAEKSAPVSAFEAMKKARKKELFTLNDFDKKKSEAKTMVEEQAQESEDEYAGLGGASDDESGGEDDDFVKEMIDQGEVDVNERRLAAFYA